MQEFVGLFSEDLRGHASLMNLSHQALVQALSSCSGGWLISKKSRTRLAGVHFYICLSIFES